MREASTIWKLSNGKHRLQVRSERSLVPFYIIQPYPTLNSSPSVEPGRLLSSYLNFDLKLYSSKTGGTAQMSPLN